jgi:spermidine synthase
MSNKNQLIQQCKHHNCKVLEIGVAEGNTMVTLLESNPTLEYVGIDPWKWSEEMNKPPHALGFKNQDEVDEWYERVLTRLEPFKERGRVIRGFSSDVLLELKEKFDVIHIDGDHTYEGCNWDLNNCLHLLKEDGTIVVDDVHYLNVITKAWQ